MGVRVKGVTLDLLTVFSSDADGQRTGDACDTVWRA